MRRDFLFIVCLFLPLFCAEAFGVSITTTLDTTAPSPAYRVFFPATGTQTGRLFRNSVASVCGSQKPTPAITDAGLSFQFDSYTFVADATGCLTLTITAPANRFLAAAYTGAGFNPSDPTLNYLADAGNSDPSRTLAFNVTAGQVFTIVVSEVQVGGGNGLSYTLDINGVPLAANHANWTTTFDTSAPASHPLYLAGTGTQTGRLFRDSVASTCNAPKTVPNITDAGLNFRFDSYKFIADRAGCVTVTITAENNRFFVAAYTVFSPGNPQTNYIADAGNSDSGRSFSFSVTTGQQFVIIVHEVATGGGLGRNYTLDVKGTALRNSFAASPADFDFDGKTDISIFRPAPGEWWYLRSSNGGNAAFQFGASTDKLTPADWTGDGKVDGAFWRPSTGTWFILRSEDGSFFSFPFGQNGDIPAVGDFDVDGLADAAIFRPSSGTWFINKSSGGTIFQQFGQAGDVPVVGDYDGDGISDIAIYRPSNGQWWIDRSSLGTIAFTFGISTDKPVPGDYTGDGKTDAVFWRPSNGNWFILRSENSSFFSVPFGQNGDLPAPGDYDGDGKFDTAVFRPSTATWFVQRSTAGQLIQTFGVSTDKPVPGAFVP
jgi:hypothetical protein